MTKQLGSILLFLTLCSVPSLKGQGTITQPNQEPVFYYSSGEMTGINKQVFFTYQNDSIRDVNDDMVAYIKNDSIFDCNGDLLGHRPASGMILDINDDKLGTVKNGNIRDIVDNVTLKYNSIDPLVVAYMIFFREGIW